MTIGQVDTASARRDDDDSAADRRPMHADGNHVGPKEKYAKSAPFEIRFTYVYLRTQAYVMHCMHHMMHG